jgi:hypothetical protein
VSCQCPLSLQNYSSVFKEPTRETTSELLRTLAERRPQMQA